MIHWYWCRQGHTGSADLLGGGKNIWKSPGFEYSFIVSPPQGPQNPEHHGRTLTIAYLRRTVTPWQKEKRNINCATHGQIIVVQFVSRTHGNTLCVEHKEETLKTRRQGETLPVKRKKGGISSIMHSGRTLAPYWSSMERDLAMI